MWNISKIKIKKQKSYLGESVKIKYDGQEEQKLWLEEIMKLATKCMGKIQRKGGA